MQTSENEIAKVDVLLKFGNGKNNRGMGTFDI
jgi:hypothetical protein